MLRLKICLFCLRNSPKCVKNRKNSKHVGMRKMSLISHFLLVPLICVQAPAHPDLIMLPFCLYYEHNFSTFFLRLCCSAIFLLKPNFYEDISSGNKLPNGLSFQSPNV